MATCSLCKKKFRSTKACEHHIKATHQKRLSDAQVINDDDDGEMSLAEIAVEAEIKRACGEELDALEESLLP